MPAESWIAQEDLRKLKKAVLTIPLAPSDFPAIGLVATMTTPDLHVWHLHAESDADSATLAQLLGILILNDVEPVIPVPLMPARAPSAFFLKDGGIRTTRGFLLAPWAVAEIKRLAAVLATEHADYLRELALALRQEESAIFGPLEDGVVFKRVGIPSARFGPPPPGIPVRLEESERVRFGLRWDQVIAQDYARNRYMLLLSDEQLARRTEDVVGNIHVIDEQGLVSVDPSDPFLHYWLARLSEIQAEMHLRHGPYPAGWDKRLINLRALPMSTAVAGTPAATVRLSTEKPLEGDELVKYGRREHLELALSEGLLRLSPAGSYRDPSLNSAIRDEELETELWCDPSVPFNAVPPGTILFPPGRQLLRARSASDYYVFCLAKRLSVRLLLDFEADACLLIRDTPEFLKRLDAAMPPGMRDWKRVAAEVEYFDPLQVNPAEVTVFQSKHFRFAYQQEFRVAWLPPRDGHDALEPLMLRLGTLTDIAELVVPT